MTDEGIGGEHESVQEIQNKINQVRNVLPANLRPPMVRKSNPEDSPILWLALTTDVLSAEEALRCGFVQEVVAHGDLLPAALGIVDRIAAVAPLAVAAAKRLVNAANDLGLAESVDATAHLFSTAEHAEAVDAFLAKRPLEFRRNPRSHGDLGIN